MPFFILFSSILPYITLDVVARTDAVELPFPIYS
jgi:hypothetical protein